MNILFFLTPKSHVAYVLEDSSLRQVAEKLTFHHYTAIPILTKDGHYIDTISEGDLFRYVKEHCQLNYASAESIPIMDVPIERKIPPIKISSRVEDLYSLILQQNFVPVLDDQNVFIGIVTRASIMGYLMKSDQKKPKE
jgi:predicted transcriptional regulator